MTFMTKGVSTVMNIGRTVECCHAVVRQSKHYFLIRCFCRVLGRQSNRRQRRSLGSWLSMEDHC